MVLVQVLLCHIMGEEEIIQGSGQNYLSTTSSNTVRDWAIWVSSYLCIPGVILQLSGGLVGHLRKEHGEVIEKTLKL